MFSTPHRAHVWSHRSRRYRQMCLLVASRLAANVSRRVMLVGISNRTYACPIEAEILARQPPQTALAHVIFSYHMAYTADPSCSTADCIVSFRITIPSKPIALCPGIGRLHPGTKLQSDTLVRCLAQGSPRPPLRVHGTRHVQGPPSRDALMPHSVSARYVLPRG